ncbi:MAG: aminotransferase class I/II-fold pyridoxal phosphate-dependent enzyme [Bacteroidales bacterium]|jgi:aspartate/methionine/tyrosine aminotransferase|nr:aminotransferase class I/II-fold pyridoxal phosphate-dependent enzyme [Bacteroidales bacterium]
MNLQAKELNQVIRTQNPAVYELLSERGRNIFFPRKGILGQSADAKGTRINATIGAAIEDDGTPMRLDALASRIQLDPALVFPYAPSYGRADIRTQWKSMLYLKNPSLNGLTLSLPVVTNALTHAVSMAGYLFANPGDEIITPDLFWGNYNLILNHGYGTAFKTYPLFDGAKMNIAAFKAAINGEGNKKILILNFPNNPTGYSPTVVEAMQLAAELKQAAESGKKIVVFVDDAYFGLVYEDGVEKESIFTRLANLHENLLAVKLDGPTKEDYVWGFRVGFITYGIKGGTSELYAALEQKTAGAVRGNISNASNLSQSLLVQAFQNPDYYRQKEEKFAVMKERFLAVKQALLDGKYDGFFTAMPYNSGYFMCIKLADGIDGEQLRALLISKYSIGIINLNNMIRIAFSAVAAKDVKSMFDGIYEACKELRA